MVTLALAAISAAAPFIESEAAGSGEDYVRGKAASSAAKAYFNAVPGEIRGRKVVRSAPQAGGEDDAWYAEDGSISIPPGGMIEFKVAGRCMDPHLPAPAAGEPMQLVDASKLVPRELRGMYENLVERMSLGDRRVMAANPQHLVWAIRTAGTEDPFAENLTDGQLEILDECAGRRGAFLKYHDRAKRKNARKARSGRGGAPGVISVGGGVSYDAGELTGTNATRRIESHIAALTEMGQKATTRTASDFRYGEIEEDMYSDIRCDGGLSFTARIINASERRREFKAAMFAAQVGDGEKAGGMRQRVTMGPPPEFMAFAGAVVEGVEIERDGSVAYADETRLWKSRGRSRGRSRRSGRSAVAEVTTVPPVAKPVPPAVIRDTVTNEIVRTSTESVRVRVVSAEYDAESRSGLLKIEIISGSFKDVVKYVRSNLGRLVRIEAPGECAAAVPADAELEAVSMSVGEDGCCEIKFRAN